ncbi:sodium:solute symporter family protein [Pseudidiomarina marina]|uniref:Urea transporter n=1 Tax=Pseudidiomarina marina TaxID=502366 RepID=A0A432YJ64_9GAMM|nr:sodium:solute symporter family protein [Pseudidiomarina marina]PHR65844.1 MAG: urea transporter [Idiomarina sp.]RUO60915.1 urea transporter [Pseudidiomarina marina]
MSETADFALDSTLGLSLVVIFGLLWIIFGWYLGRANKTHEDFALAGRNVGFALAAATAMATWVTSNTTLVAPQLTYQFGIWGMVGYSFAALGLILFAPLAARIKRLMPKGYTSGDFIRLRFGRAAWWVFMVISVVYAFGWLVSLGMAGGILLQALSGLDYHIGMTAILIICVGYTLFGGLRAVIATDFIQALIIIIGVVGIAWYLIDTVSLESIHTELSENHPRLLDLMFPAAIMFLFNNIFFGLGEIFHSNVWWSRALAFKGKVAFKAFLLGGLLWLPIPIVTGFIALAAPQLGIFPPSADMVGPMVAAEVLGKVGAIVVFIVVFSALASSLDSLLAATSDLVTRDFYHKKLRPQASDKQLFKFNRYCIAGIGLLTWLFCLPQIATLGALLNFAGAFVASTIFPIVLGLYQNKLSGTYAAVAMASGTLLGLVSYFTIGFYVAALTACAISAAVCAVGVMRSRNRFDWNKLQESS